MKAPIKGKLGDCELQQVTKGDNGETNLLAKIMTAGEQHLTQPLPFEVLQVLTTETEDVLPINITDTWMTLIYKFLI